MKRNNGDIKSVPTLVTACCVLHNLCEMHGDASEEAWICTQTETNSGLQSRLTSTATQSSGTRIREALCDYFDN